MSSEQPTMIDVAQRAGVGVATVDRVLNRRAAVRQGTQDKVLRAVAELGFSLEKFRIGREMTSVPAAVGQSWRLAFVLLSQASTFYHDMAESIRVAAKACARLGSEPEVLFLDHDSPPQAAQLLMQLGERYDAIALVTLDHPAINQAIDSLAARGTPVFSLITDVTASQRAGYLGIDNRKAGRTAAWAITRLSCSTGKVGILLGDHRFLCQELSEISFRSYFRERQPGFSVLEATLTSQSPDRAYTATCALLARHPDLAGLYVSGGGVEGVIKALREHASEHRAARRIVVVCTDLTEATRDALVDETIDLVLSHPRDALARQTIDAMCDCLESGGAGATQVHLLPFDMISIENL